MNDILHLTVHYEKCVLNIYQLPLKDAFWMQKGPVAIVYLIKDVISKWNSVDTEFLSYMVFLKSVFIVAVQRLFQKKRTLKCGTELTVCQHLQFNLSY